MAPILETLCAATKVKVLIPIPEAINTKEEDPSAAVTGLLTLRMRGSRLVFLFQKYTDDVHNGTFGSGFGGCGGRACDGTFGSGLESYGH